MRTLEEKIFTAMAYCLLISVFLVFLYSYQQLSDPKWSFGPLEEVAGYISNRTGPTDTIQVLPQAPELYFLSKRLPSTRNFIYNGEALPKPEISKDQYPKMIAYFEKDSKINTRVSEQFDSFVEENYHVLEVMEVNPPLYKSFNYAIILERNED